MHPLDPAVLPPLTSVLAAPDVHLVLALLWAAVALAAGILVRLAVDRRVATARRPLRLVACAHDTERRAA